MSDIVPDLRFYSAKRKWPTGLHVMPYLLKTAADELVRLRIALSEAEQRARREALEEVALWHEKQIKKLDETIEHNNLSTRPRAKERAEAANKQCRYFQTNHRLAVAAIRALVPSEPHDAEGRAKEALQKLAALTEHRAEKLLNRWNKDLGATPETKAAGVAAHIINDLHAEISVMLTRLDRAALERSEG